MAQPARPWMGGLHSAAAQPWTSHLPGTSAGQRSWVLAAAGGTSATRNAAQSMARGDRTAQGTTGKGGEGTGRGRKTLPALEFILQSQRAEGSLTARMEQGMHSQGMCPALLSHPIPALWHPQDVPKGEGHGWAPFSWDTATLIPALGCLFQ